MVRLHMRRVSSTVSRRKRRKHSQAQVEIRPPTFPNITFVPIPDDLEVSERRLAETCAFVREPNGKAPEVMRKVA